MAQPIYSSKTSGNKAIEPDQLNPIIDAILDGKYSWACYLLLRYAGYNPVHYLPYRTYRRLVKENEQASQEENDATHASHPNRQSSGIKLNSKYSGKSLSQISDLPYLEDVSEKQAQIRGSGANPGLLSNSLQMEWVRSKIQGFLSLN
ncbi:HetP family heterocyst commitment protein [Coleofasciculus sp. B1-GNL1-01]|jgi:hypothetical protein|uniref:HetP family heterocyst commitment protein n=1 Tax=unclassified Coleofasciculus TaxID=2692782 RepID=UPI0032F77DD3